MLLVRDRHWMSLPHPFPRLPGHVSSLKDMQFCWQNPAGCAEGYCSWQKSYTDPKWKKDEEGLDSFLDWMYRVRIINFMPHDFDNSSFVSANDMESREWHPTVFYACGVVRCI